MLAFPSSALQSPSPALGNSTLGDHNLVALVFTVFRLCWFREMIKCINEDLLYITNMLNDYMIMEWRLEYMEYC